jgi:hypothetical protein
MLSNRWAVCDRVRLAERFGQIQVAASRGTNFILCTWDIFDKDVI